MRLGLLRCKIKIAGPSARFTSAQIREQSHAPKECLPERPWTRWWKIAAKDTWKTRSTAGITRSCAASVTLFIVHANRRRKLSSECARMLAITLAAEADRG